MEREKGITDVRQQASLISHLKNLNKNSNKLRFDMGGSVSYITFYTFITCWCFLYYFLYFSVYLKYFIRNFWSEEKIIWSPLSNYQNFKANSDNSSLVLGRLFSLSALSFLICKTEGVEFSDLRSPTASLTFYDLFWCSNRRMSSPWPFSSPHIGCSLLSYRSWSSCPP